jgi:hypothetical protein
MADFKRLGKGVTGALSQAKQLAAAEREANLQKFLAQSKVQQRLYHGTTATEGGKGKEAIRRIKPSKEGALGSGVYMTPNANYADQYTYKDAGNYEGGNTLPVYAQIKNPLVIDGSASNDPMIEALIRLGMDEAQASRMVERAYEDKGYIGKQVESRARAQGYDGLMQYGRDGELGEVVSYNPSAVKSAIGNEGTYDITSPELSKADGGKIAKGVAGALTKAKQMATAERDANLAKFLSGSEFVDANGKPVTMYHGSVPKVESRGRDANDDWMLDYHNADIRQFKESSRGSQGAGVYITSNPDEAGRYAGPGGAIYPVYVGGKARRSENVFGTKNATVSPNQIKSAIGNRGTYDIEDADITKAKGGVIHMADAGKVVGGGLNAIAKAKQLAKAKKASQADAGSTRGLSDKDKAALRALDMGVPGEDFADPLNPKDVMRMSEALGNAGAEGKFLNLTQADRSRVFGPNKGGTGFSGLQLTSLPHKEARTTWGVGKPSHATRLINANDPNTLWSTFIGSPTQHMSNPVTVQRMYEAHRGANPSADLVGKMNAQLNNAIHPKTKKPIFPNGIDISDPSSLAQAQTFDQRKAIAQAMTIGGEKKGEKATQEAFKVIKEETDPLLAEAPTYAVGNRLFTIDSETGIYRPDLNEAFPHQVTGEDLGLLFEPAPIELAAPTFVKRFEGRKNKLDKPQPMGHKDLTATTPREFIDEKYLTNLQKEGHKKGGAVSQKETPEEMARFHKRFAMHKAIGGHVRKMAGGGKVSIFDTPKMASGGRASIFDKPVKQMSKGGSSDEPTTKEIAEALGELAVAQGKEEYQSFKKPRAATDIANRGILAPALGLPVDLINMGLTGIDAASGMMGKPTRLSSEKPFAGSEHIKDLMNKYGVTSGEDRPMTETMLSLFSPTGMVKGAMGATKGATKGAAKAADAMRKPMSGLGSMRAKAN